MSPGFIAATAAAAFVADAILGERHRPSEHPRHLCATGLSDCEGSRPFGRPKCESRMTLPPLSAISVMVGACRSMRVASVTLPFSVGTLRSTRSEDALVLHVRLIEGAEPAMQT